MFLSSDLYQKHETDVKDLCCRSDGPREPGIHQNSGTRGSACPCIAGNQSLGSAPFLPASRETQRDMLGPAFPF